MKYAMINLDTAQTMNTMCLVIIALDSCHALIFQTCKIACMHFMSMTVNLLVVGFAMLSQVLSGHGHSSLCKDNRKTWFGSTAIQLCILTEHASSALK